VSVILDFGAVAISGGVIYSTRNIWQPLLSAIVVDKIYGNPSPEAQAKKIKDDALLAHIPEHIKQKIEIANLRNRELVAMQVIHTEIAEAKLEVIRKKLKENIENSIIEDMSTLMLPSNNNQSKPNQEVELASQALTNDIERLQNGRKRPKSVN
jgi:hypothetical protein